MATYRFDEIAINSTKKKKPTEEDKVHYIGLEHIDPGCFNIVRWGSDVAPTGDKLLMQKGDVLFGKRRAYQRKVGIAPFDGIFSAHGMVLRPNTEIIDANYFPFFISSDRFMETAVRISVGGLSPTINWKDLAKQEFDLPPLEEQKVLADKLWAAYRLKEGYKKLLVATDEMVKSQFIEMFGNTSKEMLGKFIQVIRGVSYKPSDVKTADDPDTAVILRSNNINDANLNTDEVVYINKNRVSGDQYLRVNDIVVCASNGSKALVGKAAINKTLTNQYAHGAFCLLVRPNDNINPVYLNTFFQTSLYKKQIDELAAGSNILNIKQEYLTNMILPLPIIEEQNKFAIIAEQADKSKFGDFKSQFIDMFKNIPSVKIADCCITVSGGTPNTKKIEYYDGGDIPWLSSGEINQGYIFSTDKYITQLGLENSSAKWVPANSVVIAMYGATAGKVGFIKIPLTTNQAVCTLLPNDGFEPLYLYYATLSKTSWMISQCRGAAQPNISQSIIRSMEIPMATIDEQKQFCKLLTQADKSKSYVRIALKNLESILGYCIRQVA